MTSDRERADGIVDEIAQKGVSLDDTQWDFAVGAIAAALASVREEEREACGKAMDELACSSRELSDKTFEMDIPVDLKLSHFAQAYEYAASRIRSRQTPTGTGESRG